MRVGGTEHSTTRASAVSVPARMSSGDMLNHTASTRIIEANRSARPRSRARPQPAMRS